MLINRWLMNRGFSIGLKDTYPDPSITRSVEQIILEGEERINTIITDSLREKDEDMEINITQIAINMGTNISNLVYESVGKENSLYSTITSKSKGDQTNLQQIMGAFGMVRVGGQRPLKKINNRLLPCWILLKCIL